MFTKRKRRTDLPTSMPSAKNEMPKTPAARKEPNELSSASARGTVISRSSLSPLSDLYTSEAFKSEWANDVRFHLADNAIHLRKYRRMSQTDVAKAMGTSQSAIARIENGLENVTADTVERLARSMRGRFFVSIYPQEVSFNARNWWEPSTSWSVVGTFVSSSGDQAIVGLTREPTRDPFVVSGGTGSGDLLLQEK